MLPQHVLFALAATVAAVPLNINLGAYSPALVVGDGEISVGEAKAASELMATLAQGANAAGAAEGGAAAAPAKRAPNLRRTIGDFIAKRSPEQSDKLAAIEGAMEWIKRDLNSFNAALSYAREAQKDQPKVEMGTPNSGVGLLVNPGVNVPVGSAAAGSPPKAERKAKREEVADEAESPKMTLVAITEV